MRNLIIAALLVMGTLAYGQPLFNPATIGQASRNQKVAKSLVVNDTLLVDGRVGINTNNPTTTLDVNGGLHVAGNIAQVYTNDTFGNTVGATPYFAALLTSFGAPQPGSVFRWNDPLVQGNTLDDALLIMDASTGEIRLNIFDKSSIGTITGSGNFNINEFLSADLSALGFTGTATNNRFSNGFVLTIDSASGIINGNEGSGGAFYGNFTGTSGNIFSNRLNGKVVWTGAGEFGGNQLEHGAEVYGYSNNALGSVSTNTFETGARLNCADIDSPITKNTFKFTVLVDADSSRDEITYSDFIGGGAFGYQPVLYAKRNFGHPIVGCSFSIIEDFPLDPDYTYSDVWFTQRKVGIGVPQAKVEYNLDVQGTVRFRGIGEGAGKVLTSNAGGVATFEVPFNINNLANTGLPSYATVALAVSGGLLAGDGFILKGVNIGGNIVDLPVYLP